MSTRNGQDEPSRHDDDDPRGSGAEGSPGAQSPVPGPGSDRAPDSGESGDSAGTSAGASTDGSAGASADQRPHGVDRPVSPGEQEESSADGERPAAPSGPAADAGIEPEAHPADYGDVPATHPADADDSHPSERPWSE